MLTKSSAVYDLLFVNVVCEREIVEHKSEEKKIEGKESEATPRLPNPELQASWPMD